jgi:heme exporter protein D
MGGWRILIWGAVCVSGALFFLKLVADEVEAVSQHLQRLEEQERKEYQKRRAEAADVEPPVAEAA